MPFAVEKNICGDAANVKTLSRCYGAHFYFETIIKRVIITLELIRLITLNSALVTIFSVVSMTFLFH